MRYVVYEIWTRSRIIEANNEKEAFNIGLPEASKKQPVDGLSLSNWHLQPVSDEDKRS